MSPLLPQKAPPGPPQDPQITLAWEDANRKRAAACAWAAGLLTIIGATLSSLGLSGLPTFDNEAVTATDAIRDLIAGNPIPPGRIALQAEWLSSHLVMPIIGTVLYGIGSLLIFGVIVFLFKATRARNPAFGQLTLIAGAAGAVAFGVGRTVAQLSYYFGIASFDGGNNFQATEALTGGPFMAGQIVWQLGAFAIGFAFVMLGLNAMRVGLLTRFMGILAMIVGATFILPLDQQGVLRAFWLATVGFIFILRWPGGRIPPAWMSGKAEPWPSMAAARAQKASGNSPDSAPAPTLPPVASNGSGEGDAAGQLRKKRKRK